MQEMQVQSLGRDDPLEEGMATHSSIFAWRIPWTEEPQRAGHDLAPGHTCTHSQRDDCYLKTGGTGSVPGWGRPFGEGKVSPFQYFCLENPMNRGAHGVAKSWTQLSNSTKTTQSRSLWEESSAIQTQACISSALSSVRERY